MIEDKYLPDEIRTENDLILLYKEKKLRKIIEFIKDCRKNLVTLEPLKFSIYAKIKANLLKLGIKLTDKDILNKSVEEIENIILNNLNIKDKNDNILKIKDKNTLKSEEEKIKEVITADVKVIEEERETFRNVLLGEKLKVKLKRGNMFIIKMNKKSNSIEITLPSSWNIEIDDVFLLDLYDKRFSTINKSISNEITCTINNVSDINTLINEVRCITNDNSISDVRYIDFSIKNKSKKRNRKYKNNKDIEQQIYDILLDENDFVNTRLYLISRYNKIKNLEKYKKFNGGSCKLATQVMVDYIPELIINNKLTFDDLKNRKFTKQTFNMIKNKYKELIKKNNGDNNDK